MNFPFNIYLGAFAAAWATAFLSLPLWRSWCRRIGLVDDPGPRKIHAAPIPLAGGLCVLAALVVPVAAGAVALQFEWLDLGASPLLRYGFRRRAMQLGIILSGAVAMVMLGLLDDKHELSAAKKFGGQLLIAAVVAAAGIRITLFVDNLPFSFLVTILWIVTVTNALNFMDNMDGLTSGLGAIASWCFAWNAAVQGQYLVVLLALLACGALLGFLPYNFPKAGAFLGDSGSHLTGYLLAVLAILPHFYSQANPNAWAVLSPLLILAVPLLDMAWVVVLRWRMGRPFYVGDNNHLSHRLVRAGCSRVMAVLLIWLLAAVTGGMTCL